MNQKRYNLTSKLVRMENPTFSPNLGPSPPGKLNARSYHVSIVLPTKQRTRGLIDFFESLAPAMDDLSYEILLYADKPRHDVQQIIKKYGIQKVFYDCDVFGKGEKFSWSKLMNHGFSQSDGQWVMFGSDDIICHPCCFKNALSEYATEEERRVGGIAFLHKNTVETYDGFFKNYGYDTLNGDKAYINFGLINADAFKDTKGFDPRLTFFWADVDICAQILAQGYDIKVSLGSYVDHHNHLEQDKKEERIELFGRDTENFIRKWHASELFGGESPVEKVRFFIEESEAQKKIDLLTQQVFAPVGRDQHTGVTLVIDGVIFQLQAKKKQGISRVWRNLISELAKISPHNRIVVLEREGGTVPVEGVEIRTVPAFLLGNAEQFDADDEMLGRECKTLEADLFISTYYTRAPGVTNLVMIHDLIPEKFDFDLSQPEWIAKNRAIETADAFLCVSETTRADLVDCYPHTATRPMLVAYNGLDTSFKPLSQKEIHQFKNRVGLNTPYVMLVGNRHGYKNGIGCLEALSRIEGDHKPKVLCVGGEQTISPEELSLKGKLDIRYAGQLKDKELVAAYGGALALLVPSKYEGFGLPVIEAMVCGCPVIAYASPAVAEIGDNAVCYTDFASPGKLGLDLQKIGQHAHRAAFVRKGQNRASQYTWQGTAQKIQPFIDTLINKPSILLTAIVSTYHAVEFISGCLEDLEQQTIADRMEIIVVDSASDQDEAAVVRDFQVHYGNIKYMRTAARENVYQAWNRGIKFALGKYITNANTDDRHRRDAFEKMVGVLEQNDRVALVYADVVKTQTANETFNKCTPTGVFQWHDWDRKTLLKKGCFIGPQPVWRKDVHQEYGYFDESFEISSDFEFWLRISQTHDFYHIAKPLGLYLDRPDSIEHANVGKRDHEDQQILTSYHRAVQEHRVIRRNSQFEANDNQVGVRTPHHNHAKMTDYDNIAVNAEKGLPQGGKFMISPNIILKAVQYLEGDDQKEAAQWCLGKLQSDFPDNPGLHDQAAGMAFENGDMDKALEHFEQTVRLSPENAVYQKNLGDFYYVVNKDVQKALTVYQKVIELDPNNVEILTMAGHISMSLHRYSEAQKLYRRVLSLDSNNAEVRAILDKISQTPLADPPPPVAVDDIHAMAATKAKEGDPKGAITLLEKLLEHDCDHAVVHNDLGVLSYECGEMADALTHYEKAAALQPENELFQKNLADFYWVEMADCQKAMEKYIQVLKLDPHDADAMLNCGQICIALGKTQDARDFFHTVLELEPWNENARQMLDQIEATSVNSVFPKENESNNSNPSQNDPYEIEPDGDIGAMQDKVSREPQNAMLHNDLGILYYEAGQPEKALEAYQQAVRLEPANPNYQKNLADFYIIEQGRAEDAMALYLKVLEHNPEDIEALVASGMVCASLGKPEDAKFFYERVLEIEPWNDAAHHALNNLNSAAGAGEGIEDQKSQAAAG